MPFEVTDTSQLVTAVAGGVPTNTMSVRFLFENAALHSETLFPTLPARGCPNPTSEKPWGLASNMLEPERGKQWLTNGMWIISDADNGALGYVRYHFTPNHELEITETGGGGATSVVDMRDSSADTFMQGGTATAAQVAAKLNADATLNGTYVCTYDLTTFKFTISVSGGGVTAFAIIWRATSVQESLGYDSGAHSGAASYESDILIIHTEEIAILKLAHDWTEFDAYRYFALWDVSPFIGGSSARYFRISLGDDVNFLFDESEPAAAFPEVRSFDFSSANWDLYGYDPLEGAHFGRNTTPLAATRTSVRFLDMAAWRLAANGDDEPTFDYIKIHISDPHNPAGFLRLGKLIVSAGFWAENNVRYPYASRIVNPSFTRRSPGGALTPVQGTPYREMEFNWDLGNPIFDDDRAMLASAFENPYNENPDGTEWPIPNLNLRGGNSRPIMIFAPQTKPSWLSSSKERWADEFAYGYADFDAQVALQNGFWGARLNVTCETPPR